jgi:uncharacterized membrane protein
VRFLSLTSVALGSVLVLALAINAPVTFAENVGAPTDTWSLVMLTVKATAVDAIFSVVGAATADSVF